MNVPYTPPIISRSSPALQGLGLDYDVFLCTVRCVNVVGWLVGRLVLVGWGVGAGRVKERIMRVYVDVPSRAGKGRIDSPHTFTSSIKSVHTHTQRVLEYRMEGHTDTGALIRCVYACICM